MSTPSLFARIVLLTVILGVIPAPLNASPTPTGFPGVQAPDPAPHGCAANCSVAVVVELSDQSAVDNLGNTSTRITNVRSQREETRAHIAHLDIVQQHMLASLTRLDARILYRMQRLANSIAVRIPIEHLADIRLLPGVKAIYPLVPKHPAESHTVPFIGASTVWGRAGMPATGRDVRIAVIDSGIDYTHATFGGAGTVAAYTSNNSAIIEPGTFPTTKVIGGYDFVGDTYVAGSDDPAQAATPDPDPLDCAAEGHGTAVAALAAGSGVTASGAPYTGTYTTSTPFTTLRIDPGIAPEATLYALRVFGCASQGTEYVDAALERAVDPNGDGDMSDRVDVINMSLGATFNDLDTTSQAANAATRLGIQVVAGAGNAGDTTTSIGAPAAADGVIAVAASSAPDDAIASYSARGPRQPDAVLKPDITAPGVASVTAQVGSGSAAQFFDGTSAATPVLAGTMALLRQLHPTWTSAELKALVMNTATHDVSLSDSMVTPQVSPMRVGAGRVDVAQAAASSVIAFNQEHPERVSLSFGALAVSTTTTLTQAIIVLNKGTEPFTGSVTYQPVTSIPGVVYTPDHDQVTLAPGMETAITITLSIQPDQLRHTRDPAQPAAQDGKSRHWLSEAAGYLTITPVVTSTPSLRVPVYAAVRRASQMTATVLPITASAPRATLLLTGTGFGSGLDSTSSTTASTSLASIYELQATSPPLTTTTRPMADLAAVGMAQTTDTLVFGIGTYAPWFTPSPYLLEFRVLIDTNGSGVAPDGTGAEYVLQSTDSGTRQQDSPTDVFEAVLTNQQTNTQTVQGPLNGLSPQLTDTAIFNSTVLAIPLRIADLHLATTQHQLTYRVQTYASVPARFAFEQFDDSGELHYDLAAPHSGVPGGFHGMPVVADLPGTTVPLSVANSVLRRPLLIVHHHNVPGAQIQILPLLPPNTTYLPLIDR